MKGHINKPAEGCFFLECATPGCLGMGILRVADLGEAKGKAEGQGWSYINGQWKCKACSVKSNREQKRKNNAWML